MTFADFLPLARLTLTDPRAAARQLMALDLPREALWLALAVVVAINTIVLRGLIAVSPPQTQSQLPSYFDAPLALFVLLSGLMVIYVHALFWSGRALSGSGRLDDLLAALIWLQVLRTVVQIAVLVLTVTLPAAAGLLSLVALVWSLWILLNLVAEVMALPTLGHAAMALIVGVIGMAFGLGILLALIMVVAGGTANV